MYQSDSIQLPVRAREKRCLRASLPFRPGGRMVTQHAALPLSLSPSSAELLNVEKQASFQALAQRRHCPAVMDLSFFFS